jgi:plastocyanin
MSRRLAALVGLLALPALLLIGLAAAPGVSAGDPCYHGFTIPPRTTASEVQIKVAPCAFAPTVTTVAMGSTVTFFSGPDYTHLITGANAEWGSRDVELKPGQEVSYRFDKAGVYPYACALHRGMSGTIIVGDAVAAVGGASTMDSSGSSGGASDAGSTAAPPPTTDPSTPSGVPPVALGLGAGAGVLVGAAATWLVMRRRRGDIAHVLEPAD